MSQGEQALPSVLEVERRHERAKAIRHLLAHPVALAADDPDSFASIVRHREWLAEWFGDATGWKLAVEPSAGFARLHKVPARPDSTHPAQPPGRPAFDRRRYALLCLALAALDETGSQITLANLAGKVEELSVEDEGPSLPRFDPTAFSERRAFVDALRLLAAWGVLRHRDGDAERYARSRDEGDALYDVNDRLLGQLISAPIPPSLAPDASHLLDEPWPETEEGQRQRARLHVMRRLLEEPAVCYDELEPRAFEWLDHARARVYRLLETDAGFTVERRKEGLAAVDPSGEATDTRFPDGGSTPKHAALLLAAQLLRLHRRGATEVAHEDAVRLVTQLQGDHAEVSHWSKEYPRTPEGASRLAADALDLLEAFGLVARAGSSGWVARPPIARFAPGANGSRSAAR